MRVKKNITVKKSILLRCKCVFLLYSLCLFIFCTKNVLASQAADSLPALPDMPGGGFVGMSPITLPPITLPATPPISTPAPTQAPAAALVVNQVVAPAQINGQIGTPELPAGPSQPVITGAPAPAVVPAVVTATPVVSQAIVPAQVNGQLGTAALPAGLSQPAATGVSAALLVTPVTQVPAQAPAVVIAPSVPTGAPVQQQVTTTPPAPGSPAALQQMLTLKAELDLKKSVELKPEYYHDCLKILIQTIPLAATYPADEQNPKNPNSFISKIKKIIPLLYSKRAQKSIDEIVALKSMLELAKAAPLFAEWVKDGWIESVTLLLALQKIGATESVLERMRSFLSLFDTLSSRIDSYEITRMATHITDFFISRGAFSQDELEAFIALMKKANTPSIQEKKLFSKERFDRWARWTELVLTLQKLQDPQTTACAQLDPLLGVLNDADASVERKQYAAILSQIFMSRGTMTRKQLDEFKNLLIKSKRIKNIFSDTQAGIVDLWIVELTDAIKITPLNDATYTEGLILQGFSNDNFVLLGKAASLFIATTPITLKNLLITKLNTLLAQQQDDPVLSKNEKRVKKLIELLKFIRDKQIPNKGSLLNDQQKAGVDEWITRLKKQIESSGTFNFEQKVLI